jgi:circadian clock protein KaiC
MLAGGLDCGTSTLLLGPAGTGKSSLATQFAAAHARRGGASAIFIFDETLSTLLARTESLGLNIAPLIEAGKILVRQVDPAELSPGEFVHLVKHAIERDNARVVVIDSLNGYLNAMPEEQFLVVQLHELLSYLGQLGVASLLLMAQHGFIGRAMQTPVDVSYLADTVMLLRYFEAAGEVRQAISVVKRRAGPHERTIREMRLTSSGIVVGETLREFDGLLSGTPIYRGAPDALAVFRGGPVDRSP